MTEWLDATKVSQGQYTSKTAQILYSLERLAFLLLPHSKEKDWTWQKLLNNVLLQFLTSDWFMNRRSSLITSFVTSNCGWGGCCWNCEGGSPILPTIAPLIPICGGCCWGGIKLPIRLPDAPGIPKGCCCCWGSVGFLVLMTEEAVVSISLPDSEKLLTGVCSTNGGRGAPLTTSPTEIPALKKERELK